jgi:hypothetical protein
VTHTVLVRKFRRKCPDTPFQHRKTLDVTLKVLEQRVLNVFYTVRGDKICVEENQEEVGDRGTFEERFGPKLHRKWV